MDEPTKTLPRDEFTIRLRELSDNPGAARTSSRVDVHDPYGNLVTWTIDTFRIDGTPAKPGATAKPETTCFVQRMDGTGGNRLLMPPRVVAAMLRADDNLAAGRRRAGARRAVATRLARGETLGNPEALKLARGKARKPRRKRQAGRGKATTA